mgnify:FL=1|jgi:hypothetical protein
MLFLWIYSAGCIAALLRTIIGLIIEYKVRQRNKERYEFDYGMLLVLTLFVISSWIGVMIVVSSSSEDVYRYLTKK